MILRTKLHRPPAPADGILRPRLHAPFGAGRAVLVSAPAGYGKTSLVSAWVEGSGRRCGWLSLDEADNGPERLLPHLIAALEAAAPGFSGRVTALLDLPKAPPLDVLVDRLASDLDALHDPALLVLDDLHHLHRPEALRIVRVLLERAPATLQLVLISRSDPALPLARLRAAGALTEVRAADLRFTADEAQALLHLVGGELVPPDALRRLDARTEGWAAGLRLAGLALRTAPDPAAFVDAFSGSHRFILDYLSEEVLERLPDDTRAFLLDVAVLGRLSGPLCDALTGRTDGGALLEALARQGLFLVPLDAAGTWFRFHHLFGDLLRHRRRLGAPGEAGLHLRAADWFAAHGSTDEAIRHALLGGDPDRAAAFIDAVRQDLLTRGELRTLSAWIEQIPEDVRVRHAGLYLVLGWIRNMTANPDGLDALLDRALDALDRHPQAYDAAARADLRGQVALIRAHNVRRGASQEVFWALIDEADRLLEPGNTAHRCAATLIRGSALMLGERWAEADRVLTEAVTLGEQAGSAFGLVAATAFRADVLLADGRIRETERICRSALATSEVICRGASPLTGYVLAPLGGVLLDRDERDEARGVLEQAVRYGAEMDGWSFVMHAHLALARLALADGRPDDAQREVDAARETAERAQATSWRRLLDHHQVRVWLRARDHAAVGRWADVFDAEPPRPLQRLGGLTRSRVHLAQGHPDLALAALRPVLDGGPGRWRLEAHLVAAAAHALAGRRADAAGALEAALGLAAPEGLVRPFLDEAAILADVLPWTVARPLPAAIAAFAYDVLARIERDAARLPDGLEAPISEREHEVLRLLAAGLSNRAIGEQLFIAKGTVGKHTHALYGKLGAASRVEAVERARALGLL